MSSGEHNERRRPGGFRLRLLMLVVTLFAVASAVVARSHSLGLGLIMVAAFLALVSACCLNAASDLETPVKPAYEWLISAVGLAGLLMMGVAGVIFTSGVLFALGELLGSPP